MPPSGTGVKTKWVEFEVVLWEVIMEHQLFLEIDPRMRG